MTKLRAKKKKAAAKKGMGLRPANDLVLRRMDAKLDRLTSENEMILAVLRTITGDLIRNKVKPLTDAQPVPESEPAEATTP